MAVGRRGRNGQVLVLNHVIQVISLVNAFAPIQDHCTVVKVARETELKRNYAINIYVKVKCINYLGL